MTDEAVPDTAAVVAEIREEVKRQRAAGAYPAALMDRLSTEFRPDESGEPPEALLQIQKLTVAALHAARGGRRHRGRQEGGAPPARLVRGPHRGGPDAVQHRHPARPEGAGTPPGEDRDPLGPIPGAPPGDTWGGPDGARLVEARVATAAGVLERTGREAPVVAGAGALYAARLAARCPRARFVDGDPLAWLEALRRGRSGRSSLPVLDRLSAAELLRVMPLCAAALRRVGSRSRTGSTRSTIRRRRRVAFQEPTLRRAVGAETIEVLAEAAGFAGFDREAVTAGEWYAVWAILP